MPRCLVCSDRIGITSKGLSRRAMMYHSVVGMLKDLAVQVETELDSSSHPSDQLSGELSDIVNADVADKLRETAEQGQRAADAVHMAAHKQGGALDFGWLSSWQDEARVSMMLAHVALLDVGIWPKHQIPSFTR